MPHALRPSDQSQGRLQSCSHLQRRELLRRVRCFLRETQEKVEKLRQPEDTARACDCGSVLRERGHQLLTVSVHQGRPVLATRLCG